MLLVVACAFLWSALLTFDAADWPSPNQFPHPDPARNACGVVGAWCAYQLYYHLGDGVFPLLLFASFAAGLRLTRGQIGQPGERAFGLTLVVGCACASAHLISPAGSGALPVGHGGLLGFWLGELLRNHLDRLGTLIVLASSFFVGLLFVTEGWVLQLPGFIARVGRATGEVVAAARQAAAAVPAGATATAGGVSTAESRALLDDGGDGAPASRTRRRRLADEHEQFDAEYEECDNAEFDEEEDGEDGLADKAGDDYADDDALAGDEGEEVEPSSQAAGRGEASGSTRVRPIVNFPSPDRAASEPYPRQIENWRLPSTELLGEPEYEFGAQREAVVRKQAHVLEQTLEEFRLDARVVEIDTGPVITMFELQLGAGVKVSQIATLSNDIARALKAHAVRVVAPISGKNTVGIEVPNLNKERVRIRELMELTGAKASDMALPLFLGKDAGGAALVEDLARMPHLLIAGTTGSGKSVCLNAIIVSLLMTKRPDHVKMIVIDPKMVEMSQFKEMPHLMCPIVTDMVQAEKILAWAVTQMDERYELLAEARVKNVLAYNRLGAEGLYARLQPKDEAEKARIATHLPYIVIVIDELADLMMTSAKEVEHHLSRLAQKSRAVGVHIIVATQRPEAKVVTGLIKSNLPCRICFRVASRMDSRIVLDQNGGEVLLGQGDLLFLPPGSHKLLRAQGTFLSDGEVQAVLDDLAGRAKPEFHPELTRIRAREVGDGGGLRDPLFDEAVRVVLESRRGSVSLLQRRLTVGYSRASRLIDQMADAGLVGDYKGSQAREVLLSLEDWEAMQERRAEEAAGSDAAEADDGTKYSTDL